MYSPITKWAGLFLGFILPSIYTYLYPRLSEAKSDEEIIDVINDVLRLITFIVLPFIIIGISTRDWIIPLFYSKDFLGATTYLPYHFSGLLFLIWTSIFSQMFWPTGRLKMAFVFEIIINVISLGLVYYLTPKYGLFGYLSKFTIVPIFSIIMYFIFWHKKIRFRLKKENAIVILYSLLSAGLLLLLKDKVIYLQLISITLIMLMILLLKKREKEFLIKKAKSIFNRKK